MADVLVPQGSGAAVKALQKYNQTTTHVDWEQIGHNKVTALNTFIDVYQLRTGAQSVNAFGFNQHSAGADTRGVMKCVIKDTTGAVIPGTIRLYVTNAKKFGVSPILEDRTELMADTDPTKAFRLNEKSPAAKEDSYLMIAFRADAAAKTIDLTKSELLMPVTAYLV